LTELDQQLKESKYENLKRKYLNLIINVQEIIVEFKSDGNIINVSPRCLDVLGYESEDLIDTDMFKYIHSDDWSLVLKQIEVILKQRDIIILDFQFRHKEGHYVSISMKTSAVNFHDETVLIGIMSSDRNIHDGSAQDVIEENLSNSEEIFKILAEQSQLGLFLIQDDVIKYVNEPLARINEYSVEEMMNWGPLEILNTTHPDDRQLVKERLDVIQSGALSLPERFKCRLITKSNRVKWIESFSKTIIYNGKVAEFNTLRDITEKEEAEQELKIRETQYQLLFDNMLNGYALHEMIYDDNRNPIDYRFLQLNPAFLKLTGLPDSTGKTVKEVIPDIEQYWINIYNDIVITGIPKTFEQYSDPLKKWWRVTAFKVKEGQFGCEFEDITKQKIDEEAIKNSEQRLSGIISSITDHMSIIDRNFNIVWTNDVAKRCFGSDIVGKKCYKAYHKRDKACDHCNVEATFNEGKVSEHESQVIKADGNTMDLWSTTSVIASDDEGKTTLVIQISRDITERKSVERELREISDFKSSLLSRTSHELKTPLIAIKGFSTMLMELHSNKLDTDMTSILAEIKDGCVRMEETINKLLNTSTLESGTLKLNPTNEDLSFLIKFCVNDLRGVVREREQSIYLGIHDKIMVNIEKEKIHEVVSHLIINAIKNTPPKGMIKISTELNDNICVISVKDNGIGITEEEKKRLFKQFGKIERYGMGWDIGIDGTGMGLYISKKIVELHGGKIWAESRGRNKGAIFSFSLPLLKQ
jgi:PAS domain S-box-containing protein